MFNPIFFQQIFVLVISALEFLIGLYVLLKNTKSIINRSFFIFIGGMAFWASGIALIYITKSFFFDKWILFSTLVFAFGLTIFTRVFPSEGSLDKRFYLIFIPLLILAIVLPFNLIIEGITTDSSGFVNPKNGPAFPFFLFSIAGYFILSIFFVIKNYLKSSGISRLQIHYLFLGISFFAFSMFIFDIFLPNIGIYKYNLFGPVTTIVFVALTAYAIVVHHLMDIWIVIRLGAIFSLVFATTSLIYIGLVNFLVKYLYTEEIPALVLVSFIITLTFERLKRFIEDKTDKIFFRKHYRVEDIIDELTSVAHRLELNFNRISITFNEIIRRYFRVERVGVAILVPGKSFMVNVGIDDIFQQLELLPENPIIEFLNVNQDFIFNREEISQKIKSSNEFNLPVERIELLPAVYEEMEKLNFIVAAPIEFKGELIGIYFIGEKKSKDLFIPEELKLLDHLISEAGGLINNARLYEDLKKLDEAKSSFISVVSHQLRTPLSAIRWDTELLLGGEGDKKSQKEFLQDTYKNSIFMIYHLDDMLTALDIEEKKLDLKKEKLNFQNIIDAILQDNHHTIQTKNLIVKNNDLIVKELYCDYKKMKKIMEVLLSNAINYSPANGIVGISAKEKVINGGKFVEIAVSDAGIGISNEELKHIFEKFFRGEEAKKASPNGFGLGLYIVKSFVKAHGGEVKFESAGRNQGVTFIFTLPQEH